MSKTVWIMADEISGSSLKTLLSEKNSDQADVHFQIISAEQMPKDDDVLVINASVNASKYGGPSNSTGGLWLAAKMRRGGHQGPIILISFEKGQICDPEGAFEEHVTEARLILGENSISWFAPLYDFFLRLPVSGDNLLNCINKALTRAGRRKIIVEKAIARAWESYLDEHGAGVDHQWKGFEAILRFLRGAQAAWMINSQDAISVIEHIRSQATKPDSPVNEPLRRYIDSAFSSQQERWNVYEQVCRKLGKQIPQYAELKSKLAYRLLLVDDDYQCLGWQYLLERILAHYGFEVIADDGGGVMEKVTDKSKPIDVVLLDLHLRAVKSEDRSRTGYEGFEVLSKIRQVNPNLPVILFTATERISLERRRQQLGLVDYIVKSEQVDRQDARAYFQRLSRLCKTAIDHEFRFLLLGLAGRLQDFAPTVHHKLKKQLDAAIMELDDPLTSCHNASLAFEKGLEYKYSEYGTLTGMLIAFEKRLKHPYPKWSDLWKWMRNAVSHPHTDAEFITIRDAHLTSTLTVVLLYLLFSTRLSDVDFESTIKLRSVILRQSADDLETLARRHGDLTGRIELYDELMQISRHLRVAGCNPYDHGLAQGCLQSLRGLLERVNKYNIRALALNPNVDITQALKNIGLLFVENKGSLFMLREGYEYGGVVPHTYLKSRKTCELNTMSGCEELEHQCLSLLTLTRLITWSIDTVLSCPNPKSKISMLKRASGGTHISVSSFVASIPELEKFASAIRNTKSDPALTAGLIDLGEDAIAVAAVSILLDPVITDLEKKVNEDRLKEITLQNQHTDLESKYATINAQLTELENLRKKYLEEIEKLSVYELEAKKKSLNIKRFRPNLEDELSKAEVRLVDVEERITDLKNDAVLLYGKLQLTEKDLVAAIRNQTRRQEIVNTRIAQRSVSISNPGFVKNIVEEFAPETMAELQVIRDSIRSWIWNRERRELPSLIADICQTWSTIASTRNPIA